MRIPLRGEAATLLSLRGEAATLLSLRGEADFGFMLAYGF